MRETPSDSLKSHGKRSVGDEGDRSAISTQSQRLEALLIDDEKNSPVEQLIECEVKPVQHKSAGLSWSLIMLLMLVLVAAGSVIVLVKFSHHTETPISSVLPSVEERRPMPLRLVPVEEPAIIETSVSDKIVSDVINATQISTVKEPDVENTIAEQQLYSVVVGPFITAEGIKQGSDLLSQMGLHTAQEKGRGPVHMIRLQAGIYSAEEAQAHLRDLKKIVKSAFLLPQGDQKVLYAGSFYEISRAVKLQQQLQHKKIKLKPVETEVTMNGTMLVALQADQQTAQQLAELIRQRGLKVSIAKVR